MASGSALWTLDIIPERVAVDVIAMQLLLIAVSFSSCLSET